MNPYKNKLEEGKILVQAQNERIISLINFSIELDNKEMNHRLQVVLIEGNIQIKETTKENDETLMKILGNLGDIEEMMKEYKRYKENSWSPDSKKVNTSMRAESLKRRRICNLSSM